MKELNEVQLKKITEECSHRNWDGYDAEPLCQKSVMYVGAFLNRLPDSIPEPGLSPEPTGDLTMVWQNDRYHLIVGIDSRGQTDWGGQGPEGPVYGSAKFISEIPEKLLKLLHHI